jgi:mannose-1-phosphate guanylyltransferase
MKAVIFAGGIGTRLWPISRKKSPKQFEKIVGDFSTLQLTVKRIQDHIAPSDIYISTNVDYIDEVKKQLPLIPSTNIIGEPVRRDNAPAVAVTMSLLNRDTPDEPVIILWSDHIVKEEGEFLSAIKAADAYIQKKPHHMVFIGQQARFAAETLGWIEFSSKTAKEGVEILHEFTSFKQKPSKELAESYYSSSTHCWNLGYFVTTSGYMDMLFKKHVPEVHKIAERITSSKKDLQKNILQEYHTMPKIDLDSAVLSTFKPGEAHVIVKNLEWSDVGAWESLKEALHTTKEETITKGSVFLEGAEDSIVYNYDNKTLIVGIDIKDMVIVHTHDAVFVAPKGSASKIKNVLEMFEGTEFENLA